MEPLTDAPPDPCTSGAARQQVAVLYQPHALGLVKLAKVMLGDQGAAEDIVQDAFVGLYRRWSGLGEDPDRRGHERQRGTVKSATSRGRAALARMLKEDQ